MTKDHHPLSPLASTAVAARYEIIDGDQRSVPSSSLQQQEQHEIAASASSDRRATNSGHQQQNLTLQQPNTTRTPDNVANSHHTSGATDPSLSSPSRNSILSNNSISSNNSGSVVPSEMDFIEMTPQKSKVTTSLDQKLVPLSNYNYDDNNDNDDDESYSWHEDLTFENRQRPSNERLLVSSLCSVLFSVWVWLCTAILHYTLHD